MGRIFSLVVSLFGVLASACAAAWWFNTVAIGLFLRWTERFHVVRQGSLAVCVSILAGIWLLFIVGTLVIVGGAFWLAHDLLSDWLWRNLPDWAATTGYWVVVASLIVAVAVGIIAGGIEVFAAVGAAKRRRFLFAPVGTAIPPIQDVDVPGERGGRRIVILCDGTSNRPDNRPDGESVATNIWKLSRFLTNDETQTVWYETGVGSDSSSTANQAKRTQHFLALTGVSRAAKVAAGGGMLIKFIEAGFGVGISETIVNGYQAIVRLYRPGDKIYLVGFSRGAFAARCIAGVISRCGLLRANHDQFAADVIQIYRTRKNADQDEPLRSDMVYPGIGSAAADGAPHPVAVHFLGVFDTVPSLGFPLWGWWFRAAPIWRNIPFSTDPAKVCQNIYHALAMDERRSQFFPTLFTRPDAPNGPVLKQVWFRGAHADIGGGYARHDLSDITLKWMMDVMANHDLTFHPWSAESLEPNGVATPHDEMVRVPTWNYFGSWPRWHPVPGHDAADQISSLHPSVLERAKLIQDETGRPDLLTVTKEVQFVVNTNLPWFRTGIVIENGKCYRLTYLGGLTRDAGCPPCGPDGQRAKGVLDIRRFFRPRLWRDNWMTLAATVAHPRIWTPQERGLRRALYYIFCRAPRALLKQIAVIGKDLPKVGDCVYIINNAPSGLLYLFVNDLWQTAANNSGGPRLSIEVVERPHAGGILFTNTHEIRTDHTGKLDQTNEWKRSVVREDAVAA